MFVLFFFDYANQSLFIDLPEDCFECVVDLVTGADPGADLEAVLEADLEAGPEAVLEAGAGLHCSL